MKEKVDIGLLGLLVGLIITFWGLYLVFIVGFHSFDMAQNLIFIRDGLRIDLLEDGVEWNPVYFEQNIKGDMYTLESVYVQGVKSFLYGTPILMLGMCIIGYSLRNLKTISRKS